jgi:hypothetical protein
MMKELLDRWFRVKWGSLGVVAQDYQATFGTPAGQRVMAHLMDNVYCTIYEGSDPTAAAIHQGRRSVVHEILEVLDAVENPDKARYNPPTEENRGFR